VEEKSTGERVCRSSCEGSQRAQAILVTLSGEGLLSSLERSQESRGREGGREAARGLRIRAPQMHGSNSSAEEHRASRSRRPLSSPSRNLSELCRTWERSVRRGGAPSARRRRGAVSTNLFVFDEVPLLHEENVVLGVRQSEAEEDRLERLESAVIFLRELLREREREVSRDTHRQRGRGRQTVREVSRERSPSRQRSSPSARRSRDTF
jgi:hypothetical protein